MISHPSGSGMAPDLREIDRLVAEKVMGWEYDDETLTSEYALYVTDRSPERTTTIFAKDWCPSKVIDHAWMVVETLTVEHDFKLDYIDNSRVWVAYFSRGLSQKAATAPLAICLAALDAKGART